MQFVKGGPDIPEKLLQAHEDGKVAFFCGAGISYPARLPGFGGLVEALYEELRHPPNAVQRAAIKGKRFDTAIALLERDTAGVVHPAPRDGDPTREWNTEPPSSKQVCHPDSRCQGR